MQVQITSTSISGRQCSYDISAPLSVGALTLVGEPGYVLDDNDADFDTITDEVQTQAIDARLDGQVSYTAPVLIGITKHLYI